MIPASHLYLKGLLDIAKPSPQQASIAFERAFEGRAGVAFSAVNDACFFLAERGFSIAPSCAFSPQGVMHGRVRIAKWINLTPQERAQLHGIVVGDSRHGPIRVLIFFNAPALAIAALGAPDRPLSIPVSTGQPDGRISP